MEILDRTDAPRGYSWRPCAPAEAGRGPTRGFDRYRHHYEPNAFGSVVRPVTRPKDHRVFDRWAERLFHRGRTPALTVAVAREGRTVLDRSWGFRDRESRAPVTGRTVFGVASVTKSFTCIAVLQLAEARKLRVDDPVQKHLPEFRTPEPRWARRTRIRHLMTHSAGLPPLPNLYYDVGPSMLLDPSVDAGAYRRAGIDLRHRPLDRYDELVEALARPTYRPLGPPGERFSYSNDSFGLLGAIIEAVSGERYERYIEDHLLRPAQLTSAAFDSGIVRRAPELATLYTCLRRRGRSRVARAPLWWEMASSRAAGALRMHRDDLLRYAEIFRTEGRIDGVRLLRPASVRAMMRPYIAMNPYVSYGFGLFVLTDGEKRRVVAHSGGLKGVASFFAVLPGHRLTAVALANLDGFPSQLAAEGAMNHAVGLPPKTPFVVLPRPCAPSRALAVYAGLYGCGEGYWVRVRPRGTGLVIDFLGIEVVERGLRAHCVGPDLFAAGPRGQENLFEFHPDGGARIGAVAVGGRFIRRRSARDFRRARSGAVVW